jgi:hypothetical protein
MQRESLVRQVAKPRCLFGDFQAIEKMTSTAGLIWHGQGVIVKDRSV